MRRPGEANREVDPFSPQIERTRIGDHLYINAEMQGADAWQAWDQPMRRNGRQHRHLQREGIVGAGKLDDTAIDLANRQFDPVSQRPPLRRQFEPSREAPEKAEAKLFLQSANAVTDRALRKVQLVRSLGEAHVPGGHDEYAQRIE